MSQSVTTTDGVIKVPGGYGRFKVISPPSGFGVTGVVMVVGESSDGPDFTQEVSIGKNLFGPDQDAAIRAKYGTGPLVDAALGAIQAAADDEIVGSLSRLVLVKTNAPTTAVGTLPRIGSGTWAATAARSAGKAGNLVSVTVASAVAEVVPTTPGLVLAPPQASTVVALRANGGAAVTATLTTGQIPSSMVTAIDALANVSAAGGANRSVLTTTGAVLAIVIDSGFQVHFTISTSFANAPSVGDILYIPTGSPFTTANEGTYVVTAATTSRIDAYKLLDAAGTGAQRTAPTAESGITVAATSDLAGFSPVTISVTPGAVVPGLGKSLEIANSGSALFSDLTFLFASATASPPAAAYAGISKTGTPVTLTSAAEYRVTVTASRQSDAVSDAVTTGGKVVLTLGYTGTTATAVIAAGVMTITVVGGAGTSQTLTLADFSTVADLCAFLSSKTGYTAAPATAALGQTSPSLLDAGSYDIATSMGAKNGRVKAEGAQAFADLNAGLSLVSVAPVAPATALVGVPDVQATVFLSGGTRGGTTNTSILNALSALERVRGNFVLMAFDQDATADITAGITDASSTYDIASIAANLKTHCTQMSTFKRRRNRQGAIGFRGTFDQCREFSAGIASANVAVAFQPVRATDSTGSIRSFGPMMLAAKAIGEQAAAGYRPIVDKFINISGILPVTGFDAQSDTDLELALDAGLLIATEDEAGGFRWVIDQTTYVKDGNFVFNSLGNLYNLNVVLVGFFTRMQRLFNGKSTADVTASQMLTGAERYLEDAFKAKLLAPSDEFPAGFGKLKVRLEAPAAFFSARVVLATGILFEIVDLEVVPATSTAG